MVEVSQKILEQLEIIRQEGKYNMLDYHGVMREAFDNDYHELVVWMNENRQDYAKGIFEGFKASQS